MGLTDCAFCDIAAGLAPAEFVATGKNWVAFVPREPHCPGHVLFVPRRHVASHAAVVSVEDQAAAGSTLLAAGAYLRTVHGGVGQVLTSSGARATQTVPHLHAHVLPRGDGDGLPEDWPWLRDAGDALGWIAGRLGPEEG